MRSGPGGVRGYGSAGSIVTAVSGILSAGAQATAAGLSFKSQQDALAFQAQQAEQAALLEQQRIALNREAARLAAQASGQQGAMAARTQQIAVLAGGVLAVTMLGVGAVVLLRRR